MPRFDVRDVVTELHFFRDARSLALSAVAARGRAEMPDGSDPDRLFRAAAALGRAGPDDVTVFVGSDVDELRATRAGVCFVAEKDRMDVPSQTIALVTEWPLASFRHVVSAMYPEAGAPAPVFQQSGINPAAVVHVEARLEQGVVVDPGVVIGARAEIGSATKIGANSVIGAGVRIGRACVIDSNVSIRAALIGDRVTVHSGARIGLGGPELGGPEPGGPGFGGPGSALSAQSVPRLGRVIIQDDVEIGANAAIERGDLCDTMVGDGTRIGTLAIVRAGATIDRRQIYGAVFSSSSEKV